MKKILVVLIALLALTAFVACDSNPSPAPGPSPAPAPEEVTITFTANYEGSEAEDYTQTVEAGVATDLDANEFEREQYVFVAWNTKADGTGDSYEDEASINTSEDVTLYAQWKDELAGTKWLCETTFEDVYAVIGIVTDDDNGVYFSQCVFVDESYEYSINGYSLYGKYEVSIVGGGEDQHKHVSIDLPGELDYEFDYEINTDGQLICTGEDEGYTFDPEEYTATITFMSGNEEDDPVEQIVIAGAKTALLANSFAKEDKAFYGWKYDEETAYEDEAIIEISEDITLTAQWGDDFLSDTGWQNEDSVLNIAFNGENGYSITGSFENDGFYSLLTVGDNFYIIFKSPLRVQCKYSVVDETNISIDLSAFNPIFNDPVVFTKAEI